MQHLAMKPRVRRSEFPGERGHPRSTRRGRGAGKMLPLARTPTRLLGQAPQWPPEEAAKLLLRMLYLQDSAKNCLNLEFT